MVSRCPWAGWLAAALWLAGSGCWAQAPAAAAETPRLPPFTLQDQWGTNHTVTLPLRRLTLFTLADKQGAAEVAAWVNPVHVLYGQRVDIVGIANVSAAPRWWQGQVRRFFRRTYAHPVLLDWDGATLAALGASKEPITVLLVSINGAILYRHTGPATAADLERLLQMVASELKQHP